MWCVDVAGGGRNDGIAGPAAGACRVQCYYDHADAFGVAVSAGTVVTLTAAVSNGSPVTLGTVTF